MDEMKAGVRAELPEYVAESLNGEVSVEVTAECGDKTFNVEDGSFIPTAVGEYVIRYVYKDKLKTYDYSYTVNCLANEEKAFVTEPIFSDYYIKVLRTLCPLLEPTNSGAKSRNSATTKFTLLSTAETS